MVFADLATTLCISRSKKMHKNWQFESDCRSFIMRNSRKKTSHRVQLELNKGGFKKSLKEKDFFCRCRFKTKHNGTFHLSSESLSLLLQKNELPHIKKRLLTLKIWEKQDETNNRCCYFGVKTDVGDTQRG